MVPNRTFTVHERYNCRMMRHVLLGIGALASLVEGALLPLRAQALKFPRSNRGDKWGRSKAGDLPHYRE
jgi:hypothetical protein